MVRKIFQCGIPAIILFSLFTSCGSDINLPPDVSKVIGEAGENGKELEKVIRHYSKNPADSQSLYAAFFLLSGMNANFYNDGGKFRDFLKFVDSVSSTEISYMDYKEVLAEYLKKNNLSDDLQRYNDIEVIQSEYLVRHIDNAVKLYRTAPWCKDLSFSDFCEYVLPYKVGNEPIEDITKTFCRDSFYNRFKFLLNYKDITRQGVADSILSYTSKRAMYAIEFPGFVPSFPISSLKSLRGGRCDEDVALAIYIMRAMGLPVAVDFIPQWPNRRYGHSWVALITGNASSLDFSGSSSSRIDSVMSKSKTKMAKVYRKTYSRQSASLAMQHGNEPVPGFFSSPYLKDVSDIYFKGIDVNIKMPNSVKNKFAYLCVFDNQSWVPVHWGPIRNGNVNFTSMGKGIVYLPSIYKDNKIIPVGEPILVDSNGVIQNIISNEKKKQQLVLKRKYPIFDWWNTRTLAMRGGRFQAANKPDFSDAIEVYKIKNTPEMTYQTADLKNGKAYKYWRYLSPDSSFGSIAELEFYAKNKKTPVYGKVIGTDSTKKTKRPKENVFDNDPLTYFESDLPNGNWVGIEFDEPVRITKLRYLCWNDDNFIKNNELYELFYWKNENWKSLGEQLGTSSQKLIYDKVPSDALFLLRNKTKGQEERIFTYENGKQEWW